VRAARDEPAPRPLPAPPPRAPARVTTLGEGRLERTVTVDSVDGAVSHRVFIEGGVFGPVGRRRLEDTGTDLVHVSDRVYSIRPDDPLSAKAVMTQRYEIGRGDWRVAIDAAAEMTATPTHFRFRAHVESREGGAVFHRVDWVRDVPRNGM
jgi:hypothetical protein